MMRSTEAASAPHPWHVRIRDTVTGQILGAGMLVGTRHVLTCAHVVGPDRDPPDTDVTVEFITRPEATTTGRVEDDCWVPSREKGEGDVALLKLAETQPEGCGAPLHRRAILLGAEVYAQGFPSGHANGLGAFMRLAGNCGPRGEWVQMNDWSPGRPARGFSGAAVLDSGTGQVVGMVVSRHVGDPADIAYMIPVETIVRYLPPVGRWARGHTAVDRETAQKFNPRVPDVEFGQQVTDWLAAPSNVRVITTGGRDSERAETLRSVIVSSDREQRPSDEVLAAAPPGTVSPAAGLDLAVDASGRTVEEVSQRVLDRLGIRPGSPGGATDRVRDGVPPMTIVVYGIDDAGDPISLVDRLLRPLAEQGSRLFLVFHRDSSPVLDQARSLESEAATAERERVRRLLGELTAKVAELETAEKRAVRRWREIAPRVAGVPDPPDLAASFRLRLLRPPDSAPEDGWTVGELHALLRRRDRASARVEEFGRTIEESLARRNELRRRAEVDKAVAAGAGLAEDIALGRLYDEAHRLLWDERPCDLGRAEAAVRRYEAAIRHRRANRSGEAEK
ncbi:serine protease [Streptosporangium fragile]|uniref:Serine protease n=1 Tax=Streptosporangium fragile TaxID=46186 RepID=A0ABP6IIQ3_9ACTN